VGNVSTSNFYTNQSSTVSIPVEKSESSDRLAVFKWDTSKYIWMGKYGVTEGKASVTGLSFSQSEPKKDFYIAVVPDYRNLSSYNDKTDPSGGSAETVTLFGDSGPLVLKKISVFYDTEAPFISGASLTGGKNGWISGSDKITAKFTITDKGGSRVDITKITATLGGKNPVGAVTYDEQTSLYSAEFNVSDFTDGKANGDKLFNATPLIVDAFDHAGNAAVQYNEALSPDLKYDNLKIEDISFISDNPKDNHYAIDGNIVTLKFKTNIPVEKANLKLANQDPAALSSDNDDKMNWTATYTVTDKSNLVDGNPIPFSITAVDKDNTKVVTNGENTRVIYYAPIDVRNLSFKSSNTSGLATVKDTLTLTFDTQHPINTPTISIAGHSVTPVSSKDGVHWNWTATYILGNSENIPDGDTNFLKNIRILAAFMDGNTGNTAGANDQSSSHGNNLHFY
jgi:hypothetical protein